MIKYTLKPIATVALSSALIVSSLSGFVPTADAATKVQKVKDVKLKKGKLVKKSNGKVIKGYVSYKGTVYKDGKIFTGLLNKAYYNKGKKATGLYKSKYYKNGSLGTGIYKKHYYKSGSLGTGTYKNKKYKKGKLLTGLSGETYYKAGVLGTGSHKGKKYVKGKLFTGLSSNTYYKNGVLGTGLHDEHYYIKGKLANGEVEGILYEAGKPFTGEKDGIIYTDGQKDITKTSILKFKKSEVAVQQAYDAFKKIQEQKAALEQLAKQVNLSPNSQAEGSGDIDAFLAKYENVNVSQFTGDQLTSFKKELNEHLALANRHLQTTRTDIANAVNSFVAATTDIASTTDTELLTQIKKAVAATTLIVTSLKTTGYDTLQLENALSKLPGGTPVNNGGNSSGGSSTPGGGGSNSGGGEVESDEVITQKLDDLVKAQKIVEEKQVAYDKVFDVHKEGIEHVEDLVNAYNAFNNKIKLKKASILDFSSVESLEEFKETYPDSGYIFNAKAFEADIEVIYNIIHNHLTPVNDELIEANALLLKKIQSLSNTQLNNSQKHTLLSAILLSEVSIKSLSWSPQNVESLKEVFNKIPDTAKPNHNNREQLAIAAVNQLFDSTQAEQVLVTNISQAQINAAQKLANSLTQSAVKTKILKDIEDAQTLFDRAMSPTSIENATNALNALFKNDGQTLTKNVEQNEIDHALYLIKKIPSSEAVKADLLSKVQKAQILFATKKVNILSDDSQVTTNITREQIIAAKIAVNKITNETSLKNKLLNTLFKIHNAYNTRVISDFIHSLLKEGELADDVDQAKIEEARKLIERLPYEPTVKTELEMIIEEAQDLLNGSSRLQIANKVVNALLNENDTEVAANVNQATINHARSLIAKLPDDSGEETTKKDLLDRVNKAQILLAIKLTNHLFDGDQLANNITIEHIYAAQIAINEIYNNATIRAELEKKVHHARDLYDVSITPDFVHALLQGEDLANNIDQATINEAQSLLNRFPNDSDGITTKADLQKVIDQAQSLFITQLTKQIDDLVVDGKIANDVLEDDLVTCSYNIYLFPEKLQEVKEDLITKLSHAFELFTEKKVNALFNGENLADDVDEEVMQDVGRLLESLSPSPKKDELIDKFLVARDLLEEAQYLQEIKETVQSLLTTNGEALAEDVTQEDIDYIKQLVSELKDPQVIKDLQDTINKAQDFLVTNAVDALFEAGSNDATLAQGVDQAKINEVKTLLEKVTNTTLKTQLQNRIDTARGLLPVQN